ncbi:NUDIX hydrolase [Paenibacillus sp. TAB 01]|uniref:NUDIX hydrolase n=1 Tax=Paenibacillus sp. TAB 01 TaxID=3368988 RepID=UPI003750D8F9
MQPITFGEKIKGKEYIWRPAVYGLIFNKHKDKLAIIHTGDGNFLLPGGGMEFNETYEECLKREAHEEIGIEIELRSFIGCARRCFYSINEDKYYLNEGHFYLCDMGKSIGTPTEENHILTWLEPIQAIDCLFHEHHSWAVRKTLTGGTHK